MTAKGLSLRVERFHAGCFSQHIEIASSLRLTQRRRLNGVQGGNSTAADLSVTPAQTGVHFSASQAPGGSQGIASAGKDEAAEPWIPAFAHTR
jgi:hypothetical protein